jgi:hypothetical protein
METKLKLNHGYIIEGYLIGIIKLTVIDETENAIKVKYENGNTAWEKKCNAKYWTIIDDLGETI